MNFSNSTFTSDDSTLLTTYHWDCEKPRAIIHIVHGMSEYAARYNDFASFLNKHNYLVKSSDLRGHGKTAKTLEKVGYFAKKNGWNRVVKDIKLLNDHFSKNSGLPTIILGHSMGSFLTRTLIKNYPDTGDAIILSSTAGHPGFLGKVGKIIANINASLMGKENRSKMMTKLAFGDFNKKYKPNRTVKDWLSKDEAIVDDYINDPYCMQIFTSQFYTDLLYGVLKINSSSYFDLENKQKPIYLYAGDMDPVGNYGKGPTEVYRKYKAAGSTDVQLKMYITGRHEMLNETNKSEVYLDILTWLNKRIN